MKVTKNPFQFKLRYSVLISLSTWIKKNYPEATDFMLVAKALSRHPDKKYLPSFYLDDLIQMSIWVTDGVPIIKK